MPDPLTFYVNRGQGQSLGQQQVLVLGTQFGLGGYKPWSVSGFGGLPGTVNGPFNDVGSTFSTFLMSIWVVNTGVGGSMRPITIFPPGFVLTTNNGGGFSGIAYIPAGSGTAQFNLSYTTGALANGLVDHYLYSIDTVNQVFQLAVNGTRAVLSSNIPPYTSGVIDNQLKRWDIAAINTGGVSEVMFDATSFVDLTVATIAKFYGGPSIPVNPGRQGQVPLGFVPAAYYTVREDVTLSQQAIWNLGYHGNDPVAQGIR